VDDPRASGIEPVAFARGLRKPYVEGANDPLLRDALAAMLTAPAARPVLTRAIESAAARNAGAEQRLAAARDVGAAAEKNADVLALQLLAVRLAADVGRTRRAAQLAAHAMTQFPASVAAARLAAETFARREQWNDALDAALAWRDRAGRPDLECETFVAGALLRADRIADAEASLAPHADAALASPAANARFLVLHVLTLVRVGRTNEAQRVLADLVARSAEWRRIPLTLGPEWLGDAAGANAWLAACAPGVREADPGDRLLLARAWAAAWERYRDPAMLAAAKSEFDRLVAAPGCSADALFAAAMLAEQAGERDAAIRTYGAALVRDPGHAGARNNLAMLLAGTGRWQEAVTEATRAAEAAPGNATCLDTLAHALRAGREYARAKAALERAIALEPGNAGWRLNLAELLRESGDDAGMRLAVASVAALETDGADLSDADRVRLETLRATIR
jgi:tetratricopeptide (TPR) repeat protein